MSLAQSVLVFVLGAVCSAVVSLLVEAATGHSLKYFLRRRRSASSAKRIAQLGADSEVIRWGQETLHVLQFVPGGWKRDNLRISAPVSRDALSALGTRSAEDLPAPAEVIGAHIALERDRLAQERNGEWNGPKLAPWRISTGGRTGSQEEPVLELEAFESEHAAMVACGRLWQARHDSGTLPSIPDLDVIVPGLAHSIGLNATLVTYDRHLIVVRRSTKVGSGRGGLHVSVNEGMLPSDRDEHDAPSPAHGLVRGVREELGVAIPHSAVQMHTAMLDLRRYQFGLLGHIDLRDHPDLTADVFLQERQLGLSKDRHENSQLVLVPWTAEAVAEVLSQEDWIAHGRLNLLLSARSALPSFNRRFKDVVLSTAGTA